MLPKGRRVKMSGLPAGLKRPQKDKPESKPAEPPSLAERAASVCWTVVKWAPVPLVLALGFFATKPKPTVGQLFMWSAKPTA